MALIKGSGRRVLPPAIAAEGDVSKPVEVVEEAKAPKKAMPRPPRRKHAAKGGFR